MGKGIRGGFRTPSFTPPSKPSTSGGAEAAKDKRPVTVYRVEGPDNQRVSINDAGKAHVTKSFNSHKNQSTPHRYDKPMSYQDRAFLNFGDRARAEEFLATRHDQGHTQTVMKAFEVPRDTFEKIRDSAIPESAAKQYGKEHLPIAVDVNKGDNQFGLNWDSLKRVNETSIPGTGRIERTKPDMLMLPEVSDAVQDLFK
ncbi:hypothetical protein [Melittangium boletus]|uniref:Uncharacterized protein n=1 Tax=Melittangium boletus DSM 14713 TaxID=1294270 RepID=A0A250I9U0_9BACT|nr:hypothetical protein [Melittangium boletus]ATB28644.1 hypothetical protein MEBOL_002093 [Melittangium boletus DSM 14713]